MTPNRNRQSDARETDPEKLAKLLEIELMQKRAGWQQAKARRGTYRTLSFLFLFAVILAAFVAFYLLASSERPAPTQDRSAPAASP
ncbi:MAG TPA: hypothetical protein VK993_09655 [Chthoniobacterales bacterium]|nr:hypothetical protein [Chthoniobacterales bacterium]